MTTTAIPQETRSGPARTLMMPNSSISPVLTTPRRLSPLPYAHWAVASHRVFLGLILLCAHALTASAQDVSTNPVPSNGFNQTLPDAPSSSRAPESKSFADGVGTVVKTIGQDEWHILKAPFQKKALIWDALVVGATGVLIANDESVAQQVPVSWHQTGINISNACTYGTAAAAGGIYLTGLITHDEHAERTGVLAAEASIDSFLLYGSMKLIFARQRPYTDNADGKFFAGNFSSGSFPSGHAALSWTIASVVAHEYPKLPVQILMYGLATAVATTRVTGGQHFPSDVFVGSTLGYLVGTYVANKDKHVHDPPPHSGNRTKRLPNAILEHVAFQ
jgi:membrane-associated phospholipid phosphatase